MPRVPAIRPWVLAIRPWALATDFSLNHPASAPTRSRFLHFVAADQPPAVHHSKILFSRPATGSLYFFLPKICFQVHRPAANNPTLKNFAFAPKFCFQGLFANIFGFGFHPLLGQKHPLRLNFLGYSWIIFAIRHMLSADLECVCAGLDQVGGGGFSPGATIKLLKKIWAPH